MAGAFGPLLGERLSGKVLCAGRSARVLCEGLAGELTFADEPGPPPEGPWDTVLLAGALENMAQPWAFLLQLRACLRDGGLLIAALHNVGYADTVLSLVTGSFRAGDEVRFFTPASTRELLESADFTVQEAHLPPSRSAESKKLIKALADAGLLPPDGGAALESPFFLIIAKKRA